MPILNPYLNFDGTTEAAFNFYKSVFGGEFTMLQRFRETPEADKLSAEDGEKLMHVALPIGKMNTLMGTDSLPSQGRTNIMGNNMSLSIEAETKEEADQIFAGLSEGATIDMPLMDAFWGAYFGMLTDQFGVKWMVSYTYPKL